MSEKKDEAKADPGATRVIVEGEPADAANAPFPARTPRDVAIHKAREEGDGGLEESKPDHGAPPLRLSAQALAAGSFIDNAGNEWLKSGKVESRSAVLDPDAIRKDGGDPGVLNIPPHRVGERYVVDNPGNAQFSPEGVMDAETGEIHEKTVEEGGIADADVAKPVLAENAVKLTEGGGKRKEGKTAKAAKKPVGRGGSLAKSKAAGKARGKGK